MFGTGYVSYRRHLLDRVLSHHAMQIPQDSVVLDVGGRTTERRGGFLPRRDLKWFTINLVQRGSPDVLGDAARLPIRQSSIDVVVCTEVLEHVADPAKCAREFADVLRPGGIVLASTPFLYPVHGDPDDYCRFAPAYIKAICSDFETVEIIPMGGPIGVIGMLVEIAANDSPFAPWRKVVKLLGRLLSWRDSSRPGTSTFTTGYFWIARR